jgi:hypothetical protein
MVADRNHDRVLDQRELADFSDFQHADLNHDGRVDPFEMRLFFDRNQAVNRKYLTLYLLFFLHIPSFLLYSSTSPIWATASSSRSSLSP